MTRNPDIKDIRILHGLNKLNFVLTYKCPLFILPPSNNTVVKMLPSTNIIPPRSLFVTQATTKGLSAPKRYGRNPGADTLTPDDSLTSHVLLYRVIQYPSHRVLNPVPGHLSS